MWLHPLSLGWDGPCGTQSGLFQPCSVPWVRAVPMGVLPSQVCLECWGRNGSRSGDHVGLNASPSMLIGVVQETSGMCFLLLGSSREREGTLPTMTLLCTFLKHLDESSR